MAKKGQLWDDSSLIKAFDNAIHKYQMMHELEENPVSKTEENFPAYDESNELCSTIARVDKRDNGSNVLPTTVETGETANLLQIKENYPVKLSSSMNLASSSGIHNMKLPSANENPAVNSGNPVELMVSSETKCFQDEATYSKNQEQYNELLKEYYDIEDKRQKILLQLNQYGSFSDQNPVSSSFTAEEHQETAAQPLYDAVACYCSYGCQNWVVPCDSVPASCSGCTCVDRIYNTISEGRCKEKSGSHEDLDMIRPPMVAAEKTISSLMAEACIDTNMVASEEKEKEAGVRIGQFSIYTKAPTDLDVVLNAWYSAGFYTGKYLSENSFVEKRKPTDN